MTESSNNILAFPSHKVIRHETPPDFKQRASRAHTEYIQKIIQSGSSDLLNYLVLSGVNIHSKEFIQNFAAAMEMVRASIYETVGLKHPFQENLKELVNMIISRRAEIESELNEPPFEEPSLEPDL